METRPEELASSLSVPPTVVPALPEDLSGQTLDDFCILRRLGAGGMGQVYLAEQISLKRRVALKLLKPDLAANPTALLRFKQEAESAARVNHANIVQVYSIGQCNGLHYIALEYVEGRNLREYLARKGPPETLLALSLMRQVAAALQRASESGIVHRDVKPENILLTRKGEVKVADFGLSRCLNPDQQPLNLTQSGVTMGTPLYMAPEQVEGKPIDCRTDIYSFGVTCYHMLAGQPPFKGSSAFEVALQHVRAEPKPLQSIRPDLPAELCAMVHRMMAKDPAQRYQTCREILRELARIRESLGGVTNYLPVQQTPAGITDSPRPGGPSLTPLAVTPAPTTGPMDPPSPRRWLRTAFAASMLLAIGGGMAAGFLGQKGEERKAEVSKSADAGLNFLVTPPHENSATLLANLEQYIDPAQGFKGSHETGVNLCLDYVLPLLAQRRLDEALEFFKRLERLEEHRGKSPNVVYYVVLGHLGHGISLALRNDPRSARESSEAFAAIGRGGRKAVRPIRVPEMVRVATDLRKIGRLNRWLQEAVAYNRKNGIPEESEPRWLTPRPNATKPPK